MGYPATKVGTGNNRKSYRPLSVLTGGGGPIPWEPSAVQRPIEVVADGGTVPGGSGQGSDPAPAQPDNPRSGPVFSSSWERSEEHTSELQSRENLVCRLLLEKKNKID